MGRRSPAGSAIGRGQRPGRPRWPAGVGETECGAGDERARGRQGSRARCWCEEAWRARDARVRWPRRRAPGARDGASSRGGRCGWRRGVVQSGHKEEEEAVASPALQRSGAARLGGDHCGGGWGRGVAAASGRRAQSGREEDGDAVQEAGSRKEEAGGGGARRRRAAALGERRLGCPLHRVCMRACGGADERMKGAMGDRVSRWIGLGLGG